MSGSDLARGRGFVGAGFTRNLWNKTVLPINPPRARLQTLRTWF